MTRRQSYDAATPYYGEPQPYEKEIAKLKAEVARAEEAAGDFQELERINTELAHNLSTAKEQAGAWLNATADAKLEITRLRDENENLRGLLREAHVKMDENKLWVNLRRRIANTLFDE